MPGSNKEFVINKAGTHNPGRCALHKYSEPSGITLSYPGQVPQGGMDFKICYGSLPPVWQDVRIKSSQFSPKVTPKSRQSSFYLKSDVFHHTFGQLLWNKKWQKMPLLAPDKKWQINIIQRISNGNYWDQIRSITQ